MRTRKALRKAAAAIAPLIIGAIVMTFVNGTGYDAVASASTVPAITRPEVAPHAHMLVVGHVSKPSVASSSANNGPLFGRPYVRNVIWVWAIKTPYLHTPGG